MLPALALSLLVSTAMPAEVTAPIDLTAVGVIFARRPEASVAILRSGGRSRIVGIGETAFGGRVAAITGGGVVLEFGATTRELRLAAAASVPPAPAAPLPPTSADAAGGGLMLERREVERRLHEETARILAETSLVPVQQGSQVAGFAITRMPEGTVLSEAGLRAGDVLTEVNGVPIDSLATLISLWPRLQNETTLRAVVVRNGQPVTLTVSLR